MVIEAEEWHAETSTGLAGSRAGRGVRQRDASVAPGRRRSAYPERGWVGRAVAPGAGPV